MKIFEIRQMNEEELLKRILEEENNLVDLRFAQETKQLTNTSKLRSTKKDISKMKTILRERELNLKRGARSADSSKGEKK
ncbi:MAG: 50S ribosomal protein L29 [Bacteroidetes bacterium]|nr:50S ribosomal protein L29 [Bacteroidota bacterium]MBU2584596.1 50S ribosomal protein L29 [Bacteroidota bacterium]